MKTNKRQAKLAAGLAEKGIRLTRQRRLLLRLIEKATGHLHASDLVRLASEADQKIDRATVYRTLSLLKEHGLIDELDLLHLDGSEHHYELKGQTGHVHIGCTRCGRILEFKTNLVSNMEREIEKQTGCRVGSTRVEVSAVCPDCTEK